MSHWNTIDTDWDDPNGWGKHTIPYLNTLHPITGNLVEFAIREQHCYRYGIVQKFIEKVDARIRKILESCERHNPQEFQTKNYSKEEISRLISYVRNVTRIFQIYYQVGDEKKWSDKLPCFHGDKFDGLNVGQLGQILNGVEDVLENKFTQYCRAQVAEQDVYTLVAFMNLLERDANVDIDPQPPMIETDTSEVG